jgi:hypothetical protein
MRRAIAGVMPPTEVPLRVRTLKAMQAGASALFIVTCSACGPPTQYGGLIAVDGAGFVARLHQACGLVKATPANGPCVNRGDSPGKL